MLNKIVDFDVANGYDAFINLFSFEDIYEMMDDMDNDYSLYAFQEVREEVIKDYIREWLVEMINDGNIDEARKLFDIWEMLN